MSAYDHLEPQAAEKAKEQGLPHIEAYLLSIAISQKRLADALQPNIQGINSGVNVLAGQLGSIIEQSTIYGVGPAVRTKSG